MKLSCPLGTTRLVPQEKSTPSRSMNTQKKSLVNIKPSWTHTCSITHTYYWACDRRMTLRVNLCAQSGCTETISANVGQARLEGARPVMSTAREMICCSRSSPESQSSSPSANAWPVIFFILHFGIPEHFSFLTTVFLALRLVKFFSGHRILQWWVLFHVLYDCLHCVLSHWGFPKPNAWNWLVDDSEVKRTAFFHCLSRHHLHSMTGHLSLR